MVVRGIGLGFLFSPVSAAVINAVPKKFTATASAYYSLFMQIGGSIGISILAVLHQFLVKHFTDKNQTHMAEHDALKIVFFVAAAIVALAIWPAFKIKKGNIAAGKSNSGA